MKKLNCGNLTLFISVRIRGVSRRKGAWNRLLPLTLRISPEPEEHLNVSDGTA